MRVFLLAVIFTLSTATALFAQRFAYVDTEYILQHIPDYISAQKELDALSKQWQNEADKRFADADKLSKAFLADQVLLTDDMRKSRQIEIADKEKEARDFQNMKFGFQGDLWKERNRLVKPILDKVQKATQAVAENLQLDMLVDKNSQAMIYASPRLDKSNDVIIRLGYKPGSLIGK